jgi:hypothetical protein
MFLREIFLNWLDFITRGYILSRQKISSEGVAQMSTLGIDWDTYDRDHIREHAFHEAGHAVVEFLLGRARGHLVHISMRGDHAVAARVRRERCMDVMFLHQLRGPIADDQHAFARAMAVREAVQCFAGPAAEWEATGDPDDHWFSHLCKAADYEENSDFDDALLFARKVTNSEGKAWLLLRRIAAWTDELLSLPRVWKTVESLANSLHHGIEMPGAVACEIMERAWGGDHRLPIFTLGRKWRRRML